jgi:molybdopterin converting factor small subunit
MATLIPSYALASKIGAQVEMEAATVGELLEEGVARWGEEFRLAVRHATIAVNGRAIAHLQGRKTPLGPEDQVWLIMAAGGG